MCTFTDHLIGLDTKLSSVVEPRFEKVKMTFERSYNHLQPHRHHYRYMVGVGL